MIPPFLSSDKWNPSLCVHLTVAPGAALHVAPHVHESSKIPLSFTPMSTCQYEPETTIAGLNGSISALEFSPDGKFLASGCEDGSVTLFSTLNWKPLHTFVDVSPSTSLAWHPWIGGLLFCGFKSGDIHTLQINLPRVRPIESPLTSD